MHVSRKPGVYGQIELKTRIHKRRHKLSQWNCSLLKNQNFSIFPPLLTISEVKSRLQEPEAAKSGRMNQTYMLWFKFILGLNFIFFCFKVIIIHYHTQKQKKIKFKPRTTTTYTMLVPSASKQLHFNQVCENAQKSPIFAGHVFTLKVLPYLGSRLTTSISPVQLLLLIPFSTQLKIIAELVFLELRIKFILLALIQTAYSYGECDSVRWTGLARGVLNAIILSYKEEESPQ